MKLKKYSYILLSILMLLVGINNVSAAKSTGIFGTEGDKTKECYYMNDNGEFKTRITLHWELEKDYSNWWDYIPGLNWDAIENLTSAGFTDVIIDKAGEEGYIKANTYVRNWVVDTDRNHIKGDKSIMFEEMYPGFTPPDWLKLLEIIPGGHMADQITSYIQAFYKEPSCPKYVVYEKAALRWVWTTNNESLAKNAEIKSRENGNIAFYGKQTTENEYWKDEVNSGAGLIKPDTGVDCDEYKSIFGDPNDNGKDIDPDHDGEPSIRYYIDSVLQYVRVIVPILIILLGTIDFSKAVLAGKEDEMRKAQSDFVKRVIMGVAIFFVPLLIDVVMDLAEIVWKDTIWKGTDLINCNLK